MEYEKDGQKHVEFGPVVVAGGLGPILHAPVLCVGPGRPAFHPLMAIIALEMVTENGSGRIGADDIHLESTCKCTYWSGQPG